MSATPGNGPSPPAVASRIKNRVLVTGASGFIGRHLVASLAQNKYRVRALLRDERKGARLGGVEVITGDLTKPDSLRGIEEGIDIVVNCAGALGTWTTDHRLLHAVNVRGALRLFRRFECQRIASFVHISAAGVTGPLEEYPADEDYCCKPATPYEKTKLEAEHNLLHLSRELSIPLTILRPAFTYGPGDRHKLPLFKSIQKGTFALIGREDTVVHPLYIDDLINGIMLAIARARSGETYFIGGQRSVTKAELAHTIADALGVARPFLRIPYWPAHLGASISELLGRSLRFEPMLTRSRVIAMASNYAYSIEKAVEELSYEPAMSFRDGIAITVDYYREKGML